MKVESSSQFLVDLQSLKDKKLKQRVFDKIEYLEAIKSLAAIGDLKKLKGFRNAYRLRIGEYRLGFLLIGDIIVLSRFLSRQLIYRYFP